MSQITLTFSEPMLLPADGTGFTIVDTASNVFTVNSVIAAAEPEKFIFDGPWIPAEPNPGLDIVTITYDQAVGDLQSLVGYAVGSFVGLANPCGAAENFLASVYSHDRIDLSWDEVGADPTVTYELFRNTISIQTFVFGDDFYTDENLDPNTFYSYELKSFVGGTEIGSIVASATTFDKWVTPVYSGLSKLPFHSLDLQRTLDAPLNKAHPEFNVARFDFLPIGATVVEWVPGENIEWAGTESLEWI